MNVVFRMEDAGACVVTPREAIPVNVRSARDCTRMEERVSVSLPSSKLLEVPVNKNKQL